MSMEIELGLNANRAVDSEHRGPGYYYGLFVKSIFRLTMYGLWIPFGILGARSLPRPGWLFYFSLPLAHLAGVLFTLQTHPFMSDRYIMAPVILLSALSGKGLETAVVWIARSRRGGSLQPLWSGVLVLAVVVLPVIRVFQARRVECRSYPVAASRILAEGPAPRGMSGPVEQVAYLCGVRSFYSASTPEGLRRQIAQGQVDCYVYTERDVENRRPYVQMLRSCPSLNPPVEVVGPPGSVKVYYQRAK